MFRRTKEMLSIGIPDSSELVIYHGITDIQKNIYRAILSKNYRLLSSVIRLLQTSFHPSSSLEIWIVKTKIAQELVRDRPLLGRIVLLVAYPFYCHQMACWA